MGEFETAHQEMCNRIFELLAELDLSQKAFANMLQVSPQTITDWKKGKSSSFASMSGKIAETLNTTPGWLIWGTGQKYMSAQERAERGEEKKPAIVTDDGPDPELWELLKRIPEERMPEVERYLRFQADQQGKP